MYKALVCVVVDPLMVVTVDCDYMDIAEDGSVQLYRGNPLDLVGHFPSVEYVHLEGERSEYLDSSTGDEPDDDEDEEYDDEDEDEDEDLLYDPDDLADASHVTNPGDDTAALNGSAPGAVVGSVEES